MPFQSTVGDYQTVATLETFGFLPPMTQDEILRPDRLHHCPGLEPARRARPPQQLHGHLLVVLEAPLLR